MVFPGGFEFRKGFDAYRQNADAPRSGGISGIEDEVVVSDEAGEKAASFVPDEWSTEPQSSFKKEAFERIEATKEGDIEYPSVTSMYRAIAKIVHPDRYAGEQKHFNRLTEARESADQGDLLELKAMYRALYPLIQEMERQAKQREAEKEKGLDEKLG